MRKVAIELRRIMNETQYYIGMLPDVMKEGYLYRLKLLRQSVALKKDVQEELVKLRNEVKSKVGKL